MRGKVEVFQFCVTFVVGTAVGDKKAVSDFSWLPLRGGMWADLAVGYDGTRVASGLIDAAFVDLAAAGTNENALDLAAAQWKHNFNRIVLAISQAPQCTVLVHDIIILRMCGAESARRHHGSFVSCCIAGRRL